MLTIIPWPALEARSGILRTAQDALDSLRGKRLRAIGEVHEDPASIAMAREALLDACLEDPSTVLAVEYFNTKQQCLLDRWLHGETSWDELLQEYARGPEGFPLEKYRPLLEAAKSCGAPIIGVMPPRNLANQVARTGEVPEWAASLPASPRPEDWPGYRKALEPLFPRQGPMARIPVDRLVLAQSVKDAVAASTVASLLSRGHTVVLVMGWAHVELPGAVTDRALAIAGLPRSMSGIVGARNVRPSLLARFLGCSRAGYLVSAVRQLRD